MKGYGVHLVSLHSIGPTELWLELVMIALTSSGVVAIVHKQVELKSKGVVQRSHSPFNDHSHCDSYSYQV